ncbi:hypothetical protein [Luteolibacter luteus]|uniref:Terminase n=1 Tax=Luteolibacter luteus TaxID=2728835 RepID=A0A858RQ00_9BACT|nr:hypothetical protein [Luteolibacter luteus]QJE99107.1 hypothetical protein HHL09_26120 [Luteolibacter luteus]
MPESVDTSSLTSLLSDPLWRLRHLYQCRQEGKGTGIPFVPRPEQEAIFRHLLETPQVPAYIIKSRRLGLSTGLCTFQADRVVFESGWRGVLIDQDQADSTRKMVEIIRFAVDSLDPAFLKHLRFMKRNDSELRLRMISEDEREDSVIFATTGHRGGDCSMLHVSEWGPIAAQDAKRSAEIRSGAFPSARLGRRVVETTWKGGKGGDLWDMIRPILEKDPNAEGTVYFFPWHDDPEAVRIDGMVTAEAEDYFRDLGGRLGKAFSPEQKKWWIAKKLEQGMFMNREYPSTLDEAFRAPIEGAVFARRIDEARAEGRIFPFPWDRSAPVHTFWDLGSMRNTRVTYLQFVGREIHAIDHDDGKLEMSPAERVAHMRAKGYPYGFHFMPHDAGAQEKSGKNFQQQMREAGLESIRILPRPMTIWPGINKVDELLPRFVFRIPQCDHLVASLEQYHTKKSNVDGHLTDMVVQDWSTHSTDTLRVAGEAMMNGMLKGQGEVLRGTGAGIHERDRERVRRASAGRYSRR